METKDAIRALSALAHENRLSIFRLLVQAGPAGLVVGKIAESLEMANATLSFHLKELVNAGLIVGRQESRFIHYSTNYKQMGNLLSFLTENCCQGSECEPTAKIRANSKRRTK